MTSTPREEGDHPADAASDTSPGGNPCAAGAVRKSSVVVFDADGEQRWSVDLRDDDRSRSQASPVIRDELLFTNEGGELRAFDLSSGRERWSKDLAGPVYASWAVGNLLVAVVDQVSQRARVVALDTKTGAEEWVYEVPGRGLLGNQRITSDKGLAVVQATGGALVVIDLASGRPRWSTPGGGEWPGFTTGDGVVVRNEGTELRAYNSKDGTLRWSVESGSDLMPRVVGDLVISSSGVEPNPAPFAAYRLDDGRRVWEAAGGYKLGTVHVTSAGVLVDEGIDAPQPSLLLLDVETGAVRWKVPADVYLGFEPLIVDEHLVTVEGRPGDGGRSEIVIRRREDGSIERTIAATPISAGVADGGLALFAGLDGTRGTILAIRNGELAWKASVDRMIQRAPTPLPGGGAAVQTADPFCATALGGSRPQPAPSMKHPVATCPDGREHCIVDE